MLVKGERERERMGGWANGINMRAMIEASTKELKRVMDSVVFWFRRKLNHRSGSEFWYKWSMGWPTLVARTQWEAVGVSGVNRFSLDHSICIRIRAHIWYQWQRSRVITDSNYSGSNKKSGTHTLHLFAVVFHFPSTTITTTLLH